jgi:hypothetical protein
LGLRSARAAELTGGLQQGHRVIIQPDDRIVDGTRIREAEAGS